MLIGVIILILTIADLIIESNSIPDKLVILSDIKFDQAFDNNLNSELPYNTFKDKFIDNHLNVPKIIYWNLNLIMVSHFQLILK